MAKWGLALACLVMVGCCHRGKFPARVAGGSLVQRDELVDGWGVNGDKVCPKVIEAAPGCYVLEVTYSAKYVKQHGDAVFIAYPVWPIIAAGAVGMVLDAESKTHRARYDSGPVTFAMRVEPGRTYYVTSTFTGDEFIPRIVVTDAAGARLGALLPTRDETVLAACRQSQTTSLPQNRTLHMATDTASIP